MSTIISRRSPAKRPAPRKGATPEVTEENRNTATGGSTADRVAARRKQRASANGHPPATAATAVKERPVGTARVDGHRTADQPAPPAKPESGAGGSGGTERRTGRGRAFLRGLRTFVVVVALLAAAGAGGAYVVRQRLAAQAFVDIGKAVLTAEAVSVGSPEAAVVTRLLVAPQSRVKAGQEVAEISVTSPEPLGGKRQQMLRAPIAGAVASVNVTPGGVIRAGEPVVVLYDQAKLTFNAEVSVSRLKEMRLGMTAYISGAGLDHRISAVLDHIVPKVGSEPGTTPDRLTAVLIPMQHELPTVSRLVPGLPFHATVDTKTAVDGTPAVTSAG